MLGGILTAAAYFVLVERRMAAWIQDRRGPNRVGLPLSLFGWRDLRLFGLGQPTADGVKLLLKEDVTPAQVDRPLFTLAPLVIMVAALSVYAVIPMGSQIPPLPSLGIEEPIDLVVAPRFDVALIFVFAVSSIAVYGVIVGGWASNSKYSFLGGLRSSAQMISYELPLGLGILGVVLATGSLDPSTIIQQQADSGAWFAFTQPLGFVIFTIAAFAEAGRLPFDLPECEQELVGGYHTEYSGMKLVLFLTAEFIHMITASFLIVVLFLGGWHFWGLTGSSETLTWMTAITRVGVLMMKTVFVIIFFMLVRWSWPRFRFDQLMSLAWKTLLPLGIVNFIAIAVVEEWRHTVGGGDVMVAVACGWVVMLVAWLGTAWLSPTMSDNRPHHF